METKYNEIDVNGKAWLWFIQGVVLNIMRPRLRYPIILVDFLTWSGDPNAAQSVKDNSYIIKDEDISRYISEFIEDKTP